ncbi:MAG: hypothetical protein FJ224_05845 [Lentisphaerae bacterium]|nr:hypothetical protein [Lentisphaerota bacterium]
MMRKPLKHLPGLVARTVRAFYRRQRFYGLLRVLLAPVLCFGVLALVAMHIDRFFFLESGARRLLSLLSVGVSAAVALVALGVHMWRRLSVRRVAYELEAMLPKSAGERLVTLDSVLSGQRDAAGAGSDVHAALVAQLTAETEALCRATPRAGRLARDARLRRQLRAAVVLAALWTGFCLLPGYQFPLMMQRLLQPGANLSKPSFMRLTVTPEAPVIGRNGEVVVQVNVEGEIPALLRRPLRWIGADSEVSLLATGSVTRVTMGAGVRAMNRVQRRLHVASISDVKESFGYRVRCGDAQTDIRLVRVVPQPRVTALTIEAEPPAYTKLAAIRVEQPEEPVSVFAGSRVQVRFASDQSALRSVQLIDPRDDRVIAEVEADSETGDYLYAFEMKDSVEMEVRLVNRDGFANVERAAFSLALLEDAPPGVRLAYPLADVTAVQGDLVPVDVALNDDLGLQEAAIHYRINPEQNLDAAGREVSLVIDQGRAEQRVLAQLDTETLGAVPGDEIVFWVRARDTGLNDQQSRVVRIRVTSFGGNENERRRLAALQWQAKALASAKEDGSGRITFDKDVYEQVVSQAQAQEYALPTDPVPDSLLVCLEREHHFTDSAAAAEEVRLLYGMVAALALPSIKDVAGHGEVKSRVAAMRSLATDRLPAIMRERQGRDLIQRCFSLRSEIRRTLAPSADQAKQSYASSDRRRALLLDAIDALGSDMASVARLSSELDLQGVLSVSREISLATRDLGSATPERSAAVATSLDASFSKWIELLNKAIPRWHEQRLAARAFLRGEDARVRKPLEAAWERSGRGLPGAVGAWLQADARMVERSPFLGLERRLVAVSDQEDPDRAGYTTENILLRRLAVESEYAQWLSRSRLSEAERKVAVDLMAMDLAGDNEAHAAADMYKRLPAMSRAVAPGEPYDEALAALADQVRARVQTFVQNIGSEAGIDPDRLARELPELDMALARWETDVLRVSYRMHLDLSYSNPARPETLRLVATLAELRDVMGRYRGFVPSMMAGIRTRVQRGSRDPREAMALQIDIQALAQRVDGLAGALSGVIAQARGETKPGVLGAGVRECLTACAALWQLSESETPGAVANAFFANYPGAGIVVIEQRQATIEALKALVAEADEILRAEPVDRERFLELMSLARRTAEVLEGVFTRFAALDAGGAMRGAIAEIRGRTARLERQNEEAGDRSRDRLALDELRRGVVEFAERTSELIAAHQAPTVSGWWGGPAGIWSGEIQRDAQHARGRIQTRYAFARRVAVLGLDAVSDESKSDTGIELPGEALNAALFAWRTLNSSLGDVSFSRKAEETTTGQADPLVKWLMEELEQSRKALQAKDGVKRYREPMSRLVDSLEGYLRR